jgi:hypothetical protein
MDLLAPKAFARGWAVVLAALVVIGLALQVSGHPRLLPGLLEFDWTHTLLHVVLLGLAAYFGWMAAPTAARTCARVFGVGGLLVALTGLIPPLAGGVHSATGWHFELGEDLLHGAVGIWGAVAGFRRPAANATPSRAR